jgi:two-component sensor histidine kinase
MSGLINRIQGLAAVHSLLSHSEWAPLNLAQLIGQIIRNVLQALPHGQEFRVKITPSSIKVTSQQAYYLAQVINELTTNSVRHGVAGKIGQISVTIAM